MQGLELRATVCGPPRTADPDHEVGREGDTSTDDRVEEVLLSEIA